MAEGPLKGGVVSGGDLSPEQYERLALKMLAVEAGDVVDVKDAMRKIIASAPEGADIAFLLSRALAHAGDRALTGEGPLPASWEQGSAQHDHDYVHVGPDKGRRRTRCWAAAAAPFVGAAALFGWLGEFALHTPDDGPHAAVAATSMIAISLGFLGAALAGRDRWFLKCGQPPSIVALSPSPVSPPGWYLDPWGQGTSRWWDGSHWSGRIKGGSR